MIPGPRAHPLVRWAALSALVALAAGCSDDAPSSFAGVTLPPATMVLGSAAPRPPSTVAPSTVPATAALPGSQSAARTTAPITTAAAATTQPPAPCDQSIVETDIGPAEEGYLFVDLRCEGAWATMIAQSQQPTISTDEPVILRSEAGRWAVVAAGGITSCEAAGVPLEVWSALGCSRWQRAS